PPSKGSPTPAATSRLAPPPTPPPTPAPTPAPSGTWMPGKYMTEAVGLVAGAASRLDARSNYGFSVEHSAILGAFVRQGQKISMRQSFLKAHEYVLLGGGSSGAEDVDLAIVDANGNPVAADISADATPVVKFRPPADGTYEIRLVLSKSRTGGNFVAVATMRTGGYSVPRDTIVASFSKALNGATRVAGNDAIRARGGLVFHEEQNWSFYATVLKPREKTAFSGLRFVKSPTIVLAGGDTHSTNIDLAVEDMNTQAMVAKDVAPDPMPLVVVNSVDPSHRYRVHVENVAGNGPSLVTMLVLDTGNSGPPSGGGTTLAAPR
ncbi:MAG TPA: hypothetical protein PK141_22935, partial [Polyangiaceae bacterium]|nr:hypothetical protein [Polyangiaceae bacterium]